MDHLQSVQHIFSDRLFRIPDYQRGYAWHHQQWVDLLEDLELLAEGRDHFTGTLVLCRAQGIPRRTDEEGNGYDTYDVIDGQQRLTTIVMLLDAIRDEMARISSLQRLGDGIQRRYLSVTDRHGQPIPKLRLGRDDHEFFFRTVLGQAPDIGGATLISHQRLQEGHRHFERYLAEQRRRLGPDYPAWLETLFQKVTEHLQMLVYIVDSEADAGVIFETMNDRGKPITEVEKVKNHLLYLASKLDLPDGHDLVERINTTWTSVFRNLMRAGLVHNEDEDRLLRVHWLTVYDYQVRNWEDSRSVKARFSLRAYQGRHSALLADLTHYVETLGNVAIAYADIYRPTHSDAFNGFAAAGSVQAQVVEASERLRRLGQVAPFLPLLIAIRLRFPNDADGYLRAVTAAERFAFRAYTWRNLPSNVGLSRLTRIGFDLFNGRATLSDALDDLQRATLEYCSDEQFAARFDAPENWYEWSGIKYFLYEYEQHLAEAQHKEVKLLWSQVEAGKRGETIEHILPQHPDAGGYWYQQFTPEQMAKYIHDIGNLCLTQDNSALGNKPFPDKKGVPGQQTGYVNSVVFMEKALAGYADWNETALLQRRDEIRKWALARWKVERPLDTVIADEQALMRRVLSRRDVPSGHRDLFKALYAAGEKGLSVSELSRAIGRAPSKLAGILGSLGHRVQRTEGVPPGKPLGIGLLLDVHEQDNEWRYWLRPAFRALLESGDLDHLRLLE